MDDEAFYRARADIVNQLWHEQLRQMDLSELPPEQRDRLEKKIERRLLKQAVRDQRDAEKKSMRRALHSQRKNA